ncbi:hypothetical protein MPSEU_000272800 [Mayamaea pseudoterrestris]|nr:hypothetical protein MPSEU_000272800 [Mayamaea pseudoterrestris]
MIHQTSLPPVTVAADTSVDDASSLAGSLIQIGSELFSKGYEQDAMAMFDSANSVLKRSTEEQVCLSSAVSHLHMGSQVLMSDKTVTQDATDEEPAADLYQEDECDVGPRMLREAMRPAHAVYNASFLETCLLFNKALIYHENQQLETARHLYQSVLQVLKDHLDSSSKSSQQLVEMGTRAHNNMGCIFYLIGEEELSRAHFEASLICLRQLATVTREHRLQYATILSNCCRVAWMEDIMTDNLYNSLREVLSIRSLELPWDHVDVASAHFNLGVAEYARHQPAKALSHLTHYLHNEEKEGHLSQELTRGLRTLQDKRQEQGTESPEVASVLNFIGTVLFHMCDYERALSFFQEELRLEEIICSANSTDDIAVSVTCNNIGRIYQEMARMTEAVHFYQRALKTEAKDAENGEIKVPTKSVTEAYPSFANLYSTVWYNLGLIHDKLGAYAEAIHAFSKSLELRRAMLGRDHPDCACLLYNIAVLQMESHSLKEATASFREVLRIRRLGLADQLVDRHVVKTLEKLASLHKAKGDIDGALEASREVLRIQDVSPEYQGNSRLRETGVTLRCIAELYQATGDLAAAAEHCRQSVSRVEQAAAADQMSPYLHTADKVANMEQFVSSLLLMGSIYHESCEPLEAHVVLHRAVMAIQHAMASSSAYASLSSLSEVTKMLGVLHGAACA